MDRAAKRELVATLHDMLKDTGVIVVARNNGLVAAQSADFRNRVKAAGGTVKVAKNKLAALALDGAILLNLFVAGVLTLIVGAGALVLLQRAILRNMAATGGRPGNRQPSRQSPGLPLRK